jgi:sortase A
MKKGDLFYIHILGEVLTYEVDMISVVEPANLEALELDPQQDLATLFTCTPYGINTHRLLVRGHRIESAENQSGGNPIQISSDAKRANAILIVPVAVILTVMLLLIVYLVLRTRKNRNKQALNILHNEIDNQKQEQQTGVGEEEV